MVWDCVVVGAGRAGGAAAWALAAAGRSVLLLEQATWPRDRVCGGGVSPAIAAWFDFDWLPVVTTEVSRLRLTWKRGNPLAFELDGGRRLWAVDRSKFDAYLVQQAIDRGAEFRPSVTVTGVERQGEGWQVATSEGTVAAQYLIAADGPTGQAATWLGLKTAAQRQGAAALVSGSEASRADEAWFDFGSLKNGILWSLPLGGGRRSLCAATVRGSEPRDRDLTTAVVQAAESQGWTIDTAPTLFPLALWEGDQVLHGDRGLLAGEAAGILDPFSGEGVRPSLRTGLLAAAAVGAALDGEAGAIARYSEQVAQEIGSDWLWARRLAGIYYTLPSLAYKVGSARPSLRVYISQSICGELPYAYLADRARKRLASWLPGFKW